MDPKSAPNYMDGYNADEEGVAYESRITFPTIYPRGETTSDVTANLTIHRIKMSTADIEAYKMSIGQTVRLVMTYSLLIEQTPADEYCGE